MTDAAPLSASSTIARWLDHPVGGPLLRGLLTGAGQNADALAPVRALPLQQLVALSQGQMGQEVIDGLVMQANGGTMPAAQEEPQGWAETVTPGRFSGQTVIVTGAGSGIGRATASRVAREGGRVVAVDVAGERLNALAQDLRGQEILTVVADITSPEGVQRIVDAAGARIDALANIAGINDDFSPAHETSDAVWDRVLAINLTGSFRLMRAALPAMLAAGSGSIVNIASEAGLRGNASGTAYTVSKHAVVGLTRSAAFMYGPQGVRVNAVAPGGVATGIPQTLGTSGAGMARLQPFHALIPSVATAKQLAASITFLLSRDSVNINGVILPSDGGWSVQ